MATWNEVTTHLGERHTLAVKRGNWLAIELRPLDLLVHAHHWVLGPSERVILLADVCPWAWASPREIMALGSSLASGSLVLIGDTLALRLILPLAGLELAELERSLGSLGKDAVRLRDSCISHPAASPDVFVCYVD